MRRIGLLIGLAIFSGSAAMAGSLDAIVYGGRTLVPLRTVGEAFGASVQYDSRTKSIGISLDYQKVNMVVGSRRAHAKGRVVTLDSPPMMFGGVCYVPARSVSDSFGFRISWNSGTRRMTITHPRTHRQKVLIVSRHVPPGLAKKGGMPPGQAKKMGRTMEWRRDSGRHSGPARIGNHDQGRGNDKVHPGNGRGNGNGHDNGNGGNGNGRANGHGQGADRGQGQGRGHGNH